jgi:hypothetical protein
LSSFSVQEDEKENEKETKKEPKRRTLNEAISYEGRGGTNLEYVCGGADWSLPYPVHSANQHSIFYFDAKEFELER